MENKIKQALAEIFEGRFKNQPLHIEKLPLSGSNRSYYRLSDNSISVIGVHNNDIKENNVFIEFSNHFKSKNIPVPEIYWIDQSKKYYLQQDLGDLTLFNILKNSRNDENFHEIALKHYKQVIDWLPIIQIKATKNLDFSKSYPRAAFDNQSMMWDLNYFKYYFLKLSQTPFDEQLLEDEFNKLCSFLLTADANYFLYRDFQSRNIMFLNDQVFFIDYQGGRKGALHYDLASLLFDAKADLSKELRSELFDYYLQKLEELISVNRQDFTNLFNGFVLIRIMQAMGAYGFRGFYEKKDLFLQSIPYAINNLKWLFANSNLSRQFPYLTDLLLNVSESDRIKSILKSDKLTIVINSFSYRKGIPEDASGNGGGFVFDCRSLPNPGKFDAYKNLTGHDIAVIEYLKNQEEVSNFLNSVISIIEPSVKKYISRGFTNLMLNFGCTGGQHRSVYCANYISEYLQSKFDINIRLFHKEHPKKTIK